MSLFNLHLQAFLKLENFSLNVLLDYISTMQNIQYFGYLFLSFSMYCLLSDHFQLTKLVSSSNYENFSNVPLSLISFSALPSALYCFSGDFKIGFKIILFYTFSIVLGFLVFSFHISSLVSQFSCFI